MKTLLAIIFIIFSASSFAGGVPSFEGASFYIDKGSYRFTNTGDGVEINPKALQENPNLLALNHFAYTIWCEARSDGLSGMLMVSDIIVNRVKSKLFPNGVYEVIHQKNSKKAKSGQFSCWSGKQALTTNKQYQKQKWNPVDRKSYQLAFKIALDRLQGTNKFPRMTIGLFYHTKEINPYWTKQYKYIGMIGDHKIYIASKL